MSEEATPNQASCDPTEKTIHTEPHDDHWGTWNDSVFINGSGPKKGIGISDGCIAQVLPIKDWLRLVEERNDFKKRVEELEIENGILKKLLSEHVCIADAEF